MDGDSYFVAAEKSEKLQEIDFISEIESIEHLVDMNQVMIVDSLIQEKQNIENSLRAIV